MPAEPRVEVRLARPEDEPAYRAAVLASLEHVTRWNPTDPHGFKDLVALTGDTFRPYMLWDVADGGLVGRVSVANIVAGRFSNATLGYESYLPYAGTGRMGEGLAQVMDLAFGRMGLHRLEANIQPGNLPSIALARSLGFRLEGYSPRMLHINGAWRDCERYALTAEEWPGLQEALRRIARRPR